MATQPIGALTHIFLTQLLLDIKSPNQFLQNMLFPNHQTFNAETLQIDGYSRGRIIAPFVARDAEAIVLGGNGGTTQAVSAPNVRLKKAFTPSPLLFGRQPGNQVFTSGGFDVVRAAEDYVAREVAELKDAIVNAQEWMVAQSLQAQITYSVVGGDIWRITYPRAAANNITLVIKWDDADPTKPDVDGDIQAVKEVMEVDGFTPTDAVCSPLAAAALRKLINKGYIKTFEILRINGNSIDLGSQFAGTGAQFIGVISGVRFWQYGRKAKLNGVDQSMIRDKYVEFVDSNNQAAEREMRYAAIPDFKLMEGGSVESEIFSKSWEVEDPSARYVLAHSRPLPVPRRPNATCSMQVLT